MDGGVAGGGDGSAALTTLSFHDLEQSSALVDSHRAAVPTDNNGNHLLSFTYGHLKGIARQCDFRFDL